jgi:hypothetical protein
MKELTVDFGPLHTNVEAKRLGIMRYDHQLTMRSAEAPFAGLY